ncbi:putative calcium-binding protein [Ananas comosus]|uniref:Putative calcium-binding protein n=1 Tax=Ananas comosus TaxID=4615 RepID=A0A199W969_ANACO|nr:putative calcium-binding protein [Ananas comosus]
MEDTFFLDSIAYFLQEEKEEDSRGERCDGCSDNEGELTYDDVTMVMRRLGVLGWSEKLEVCRSESKCRECSLVEEARVLMDEKEASLEELEEAFYVFDRNEDGFISPTELWSVMRRLGLQEGSRYKDCERMVGAFDGDGDGRISFPENWPPHNTRQQVVQREPVKRSKKT